MFSLRVQLVVVLSAFTVALAAALGWLAYSTAQGIVIREAERAVGLAANARKQALLTVVERQRDRAVKELEAGRAACGSGSEAREACLGRWLKDLVATEDATAGLLTERGAAPLAIGEGITPQMRATLSAPPEGQVARFDFDEQQRPYYVVWARSEDGAAALALRFETQNLESIFLDRSGLGDSGESFLADEQGLPLSPLRYVAPGAPGPTHMIHTRPMQACLAQRQDEVVDPDYQGVQVIHGFRYLPEIGGGCIMAHIHTAEAFAPVAALRGQVLSVTAAFTAVAIFLSLAAAGWVARPLHRLANRARGLQAGEFASPVPVEGPAEVRTFARTFAGMAQSLQGALAQEREARQAAEAAVRLREEFLSVAAHELKTPVAGLRLAVQHLLRRLDKGATSEPAQLRRALHAVDQQTAKASRLVAHLLETSRLEMGRLVLDRRVENVSEVVAGVVEQAQAQTNRHELVLSAPPEVPASVDALRLEQVVTNLLDNAIKFSPEGGRIDVEVSAPDEGTVRLAVRDHGLGIPPEHRGQIFDRFHQAHAAEHRSGLGLGLHVSRGIVELHGGRIWAEFPPDGGTRFVATLPAGDDSDPSRPEEIAWKDDRSWSLTTTR
jgi:signal transduction histidine kinase